MILQAVPTDDPDEYDEEEVGSAPVKVKAPRQVVLVDDGSPWRLVTLGICCLLGIVGVGASLAVLSRYASESEAAWSAETAGAQGVLLVAFSVRGPGQEPEPATNDALAWLLAALLKGSLQGAWSPANASIFMPEAPVAGAFVPDGTAVKSWPATSGESPTPQEVLVHGPVLSILQKRYELAPPLVLPLAKHASSEADALLHLRSPRSLQEAARQAAAKSHAHAPARIVLMSHPYHLPYLAVIARATGLEAVVLDPHVFGAVPWASFGCGPLGYAEGKSARAAVVREADRLQRYSATLQASDPAQYAQLAPVLRAANATLDFHLCVAERQGRSGGEGSCPDGSRDCGGDRRSACG